MKRIQIAPNATATVSDDCSDEVIETLEKVAEHFYNHEVKYTPIDIKLIRERYQVNSRTMSIVCGFGENQWRLYESGEAHPNRSNSNTIRLIHFPENFKKLLISSRELIAPTQFEKGLKNCFLFERLLDDFINKQREAFCEMKLES